MILVDFVVVYFFSSQIWSYAGYFFGSDIRTTIGVLMFVEGAVTLALGVVRGGGNITSIGPRSGRTYRNIGLDGRKVYGEQTEKQDVTGIVLMLAGGLLLTMCFILFLA